MPSTHFPIKTWYVVGIFCCFKLWILLLIRFSLHGFFLIRYDKGAYLYLPSYVMRTHGARQQRETIRRAPKEQLKPVFEVWNLRTLGSASEQVKRLLIVWSLN